MSTWLEHILQCVRSVYTMLAGLYAPCGVEMAHVRHIKATQSGQISSLRFNVPPVFINLILIYLLTGKCATKFLKLKNISRSQNKNDDFGLIVSL